MSTSALMEARIEGEQAESSLDVTIGSIEPVTSDENTAEIKSIAADMFKVEAPSGKLASYYRIGTRVIKLGRRQMKSLPEAKFSLRKGNNDYERLCRRITDELVLIPGAPEDVRVSLYVRVAAFVSLAKALVPDREIEKMPYGHVANVLVSTLKFDDATMIGEIKAEFKVWVADAIRKICDGPVSNNDLALSYSSEQARQLQVKRDKMSPEKAQEAAQRQLEAEIAKPAKQARSSVATAVANAVKDGTLTPEAIRDVVKSQLKDAGIVTDAFEPVNKQVGFNPETCTVEDAKKLAQAMFYFRKADEVKAFMAEIKRLSVQASAQFTAATDEVKAVA